MIVISSWRSLLDEVTAMYTGALGGGRGLRALPSIVGSSRVLCRVDARREASVELSPGEGALSVELLTIRVIEDVELVQRRGLGRAHRLREGLRSPAQVARYKMGSCRV